MCIDAVLKFNQDTQEMEILGVSPKLYAAIEQYGSVLVDHAESQQPYEIYKEGSTLKAHAITID